MRVLVTVGSRHGATREIGDEVAQVLARSGHTVDVVRPDDVADVRGYGAVVLGSPLYAGRVLPSVCDLVQRCRSGLAGTSVWVFWSAPVGVPPATQREPGALGELLRSVRPRGRRAFGGRVRPGDLGVAEQALVRLLGIRAGDDRDFDDVRRWAAGIAEALATTSDPAARGAAADGARAARTADGPGAPARAVGAA